MISLETVKRMTGYFWTRREKGTLPFKKFPEFL
jgi:hypothetical protein